MKAIITINTHKRPYDCLRLLKQIPDNLMVGVFQDKCDSDYSEVIKYCENRNWHFFRTKHHCGKWNFYLLHNMMYKWLSTQKFDYYVQLQDDFVLVPDFFNRAVQLVKESGNKAVNFYIVSAHLKMFERIGNFLKSDWLDAAFIAPAKLMKNFTLEVPKNAIAKNPKYGSGIGHSQRKAFKGKSIMSYYSLIWNEEELHEQTVLGTIKPSDFQQSYRFHLTTRDRQIIENRFRTVDVYIPSLWRNGHILKTLNSLLVNPEILSITVVCNNYTKEQFEAVNKYPDKRAKFILGDNAKTCNERFKHIGDGKGVYLGFADDDLIYPNDHFRRLIQGVEKHGGIVSFHGKVMFDKIDTFLNSIKTRYKCLGEVKEDVRVHNIGVGVSLFRRDSIDSKELKGFYDSWKYGDMDDLYLSWEFQKRNLPRTVIAHKEGYFKHKEFEQGDNYIGRKKDCSIQTAFLRNVVFKNRNIVMLSRGDYAGSGYKIKEAVYSQTDRFNITCINYEKHRYGYKADYFVKEDSKAEIQAIINNADIIHFKGDELPVKNWYGFSIPDAKIILTAGGSGLRRDGWKWHDLKDYVNLANYRTVITPDLNYPELKAVFTPHAINTDYQWSNGKFIVQHSPSSRSVKGTELIIKAISELPSVELELLENISHDECVERKKRGTIFIDQINSIGAYGMSAVESMSFGVPVLTYLSKEFYSQSDGKINKDCPVINVRTKEDIKKVVLKLCNDKEYLKELSKRTYDYANKLHSFQAVGNQWIEIYER